MSFEIDLDLYRRAVGSFVTGITVVTATSSNGPVGFTCQSFTSLSLEPPMILISVAQSSRTFSAITTQGRFCVNILGSGSQRLAQDFAFMEPGVRFTNYKWTSSEHGNPVLDAALVWLDCTLVRSIEVEDHIVAVGRVIGLGHSSSHEEPLTYFRGGFGGFAKEDDES